MSKCEQRCVCTKCGGPKSCDGDTPHICEGTWTDRLRDWAKAQSEALERFQETGTSDELERTGFHRLVLEEWLHALRTKL